MVKLKHLSWREGELLVPFYDGELTAHDGIIEVPSDRPEWIRGAWVKGFRLDPKTDEFLTFDKIDPAVNESAESAGEEDGENPRRRRRTVS